MQALEIFQLTKVFSRGKITALREVSLSVERGIIFGLLGPNGAGKTTMVKALLGILFPTTGSANILGQPVNNTAIKEKVGYLPENHRYPDFLKGGAVLEYYARLAGMNRAAIAANKAKLLKIVEMEEWQQTKLKKYSKGMLQRLGLAQAMINDPEILFLDEPTDGVDPIGRKKIRDVLLNLKKTGKTIFLNSHLLSEVEMICDKVAILDKGRLLRTGTVEELTSSSKTYRFETSNVPTQLLNEIHELSLQTEQRNGFIQLTVANQQKLNAIIDPPPPPPPPPPP
ncbi:ABC transporter ATP-binding protein, partial [bacterium]|nr:ABC transporter ATP-binding protein [bacterium]